MSTAQFVTTDVSGQSLGPSFKGPAVQSSSDRLNLEDGTETCVTNYESSLGNIQKREDLDYPATDTRYHAFQKFVVYSLKIYSLSSDLFIHFLRFIWSQDSVTRT